MKRPVKITLTISLLALLLGAGILFGETGERLFTRHGHRSLQAMAEALPAEKREMFTATMSQAMKDSRALYKEARRAQKKATELLGADKFDKTAYLAYMQQSQSMRSQVKNRMAEAVADVAEQCTQGERVALAGALKQR